MFLITIGEDKMKKRITFKIIILLFACEFLISCDKITNLTNRNVGLASGVSFNRLIDLDENKFVVVNPQNGDKVRSCGNTIIIDKDNPKDKSSSQSNQSCNNQIVDPPQELLNALKLTKPINGFILKDGVKKKAVFYVGVTEINLGSHCTTLYLSGDAYTKCLKQEQEAF